MANPSVYGFKDRDVAVRLREMAREPNPLLPDDRDKPPFGNCKAYYGLVSEEVTAATTEEVGEDTILKPGTGKVTIYEKYVVQRGPLKEAVRPRKSSVGRINDHPPYVVDVYNIQPFGYEQDGTALAPTSQSRWVRVVRDGYGTYWIQSDPATTITARGEVSTDYAIDDIQIEILDAALTGGLTGIILPSPLIAYNILLGDASWSSGANPDNRSAFQAHEIIDIAFHPTTNRWEISPSPRFTLVDDAIVSTDVHDYWQACSINAEPNIRSVRNLTGRYLFPNQKHVLDVTRKTIIGSNSPFIMVGYATSNAPTSLLDFDFGPSDDYNAIRTPCGSSPGSEINSLTLLDPFDILSAMEEGDAAYFCLVTDTATGGFTQDAIMVMRPSGEGGATGPAGPPGEDGEDGEDGSPGAPGADGEDGTIIGMYLALIDNNGGYGSADATVNFKSATPLGNSPAIAGGTGTADNAGSSPFVNEDRILIIEKSTVETYTAIKIDSNKIIAKCNSTVSGGEFDLDDITVKNGATPHTTQRKGKQLTGQSWQVGDYGIFTLDDDKKWSGVKLSATNVVTGMFRLTQNCPAATLVTGTKTPGKATAKRYNLVDPGADPVQWQLDDETVYTVRNSTAEAVPINSEVQCKSIDGFLFIDVEDCSP